MANFHQAPLPFTGQKRNYIKHFKTILEDNIPNDGAGWTIVDAFGGSGLLSHHAKLVKPSARVVYNDYDGYARRLLAIPDTNRLRRQLADMLADVPRNSLIPAAIRAAIITLLNTFDGFVDVACLQAWLLFSGQQAESLDDLCNKHMYNCIRRSDYPCADGYLDGVDVVSQSYATLLPQFLAQPKALLVLDPPYVCTKQGAYRNAAYFGMVEFLRLMRLVRPPFVMFSSTRSELPDYLNMLVAERMEGWDRFIGSEVIQVKAAVNKSCIYEDNLIYRF